MRISGMVLLCLVSATAHAASDGAFGLGTGRDGAWPGPGGGGEPLPTAVPGDNVINNYTTLTAESSDGLSITVADATHFGVGDLILVWQSAGNPAISSSGSSTVAFTPDPSVGRRELARIVAKTSSTLTISASDNSSAVPLNGSVAASGAPYPANATQVVKVRELTTVTVNATFNIVAAPWDPSTQTGGIVAFLANGAVTINTGGSINADGAGFRGGPKGTNNVGTSCSGGDLAPPAGAPRGEGVAGTIAGGQLAGNFNVANGAGGGNCVQNGGGGGGNAGNGGDGGTSSDINGNNPGVGGRALSYATISLTDRITMGGGGGAGNQQTTGLATAGLRGGGVVFFRAASLVVNGVLSANGQTTPSGSSDDGQGGGGAGGDIYIRLSGAATGCANVHANGSNGINAPTGLSGGRKTGGGGGGGGGFVLVQASVSCAAATESQGVHGANSGSNGTDGTAGSELIVATAYCSAEDAPGCGASLVCDPVSNTCVACVTSSDCTQPSAPYCDPADNTCKACIDDTSCSFRASGTIPACQPNDGVALSPGTCRQCSMANQSQCFGTTPACNDATGSCQLCTIASGGVPEMSAGCASNPGGHRCEGASNTAVFCGCSSDVDCGGVSSGRICDQLTQLCADGCSPASGRNDCPSNLFCTSDDLTGSTTGVCTTTCNFDSDCASATPATPFCVAVNGAPLCVACRDDSQCGSATPACNAATGTCQLCTIASGGVPEMSAGCASNPDGHRCEGASNIAVFCGCSSDADCGGVSSGRICDQLMQLCADGCSPASGRNNCPSDLFCTSDDLTGSTTGVCTTTCNFDADCASATPAMPFCVASNGTQVCVACRDNTDCSDTMPVCDSNNQCVAAPNKGSGQGGGCCHAGQSAPVSDGLLLVSMWIGSTLRRRRRRARS